MSEQIIQRLDNLQAEIKEIKKLVVENAPESDEQPTEPKQKPIRLTVSDYALKLQISRHLVYKWATMGVIKIEKSGSKFTIVTEYPGKEEGHPRFPNREELEKGGYRQPRVRPSKTWKRTQAK